MAYDPKKNRRIALTVSLALAGIAFAAFLLLRRDDREVETTRTEADKVAEEEAPTLARSSGPARSRRGTAEEGSGRAEEDPATVSEEPAGPPIEGLVLDDETGKPIEGAVVVATTASPQKTARRDLLFQGGEANEGRILHIRLGPNGIDRTPWRRDRTNAEGQFTIRWEEKEAADLYARAPGYVVGVAPDAAPGAPVTLRLKTGASIEGVVVKENGEPIAGASLQSSVQGPGGTEVLPASLLVGHYDEMTAGEHGEFALRGLLPGPVRVTARHPKFLPTTTEPVEPGRKDLRIVLVPGFFVAFRLRPDDGKEPESPTAQWATDGRPPKTDLVMLRPLDMEVEMEMAKSIREPAVPAAPAPPGILCEPVAIPCDRSTVRFVVKAVGYEPWTSEPVEIPKEGGETTIEVPLRRDPDLGRLVVRIQGEDGKALNWVEEACQAAIGRRDGKGVPAGIILQGSEFLESPALPSGPYLVVITSPRHAPTRIEVTIAPGGTEEVVATLRPPAKVRVRFTANESLVVHFHLKQGRQGVDFYVERAQGSADDQTRDGEHAVASGSESVVLSGLATGRYTVEVSSPDLVATPTAVDLVEGDTREVEIAVSRK